MIRIEVATRKVEEIRKLGEFLCIGVMDPGAFWMPDEEPILPRDLSTRQIYRIGHDR